MLTDDNGQALFTWPSDNPRLIGSKCSKCGEVVFPQRPQCPKCYKETMQPMELSPRGRVYSATVSYLAPAMYNGPVPYAIGTVELPERVLVPAHFSDTLEILPIGTEVELVLEEMGSDDEGNPLIVYMFKPVEGSDKNA
ncbi:MAG: Zn-ribbon domain-containing OB-fold protein [Clostridia bacterium]|nr:MAG: Zn-ribbon domain-containing OB-fold protein [Clostridia bacterium]